MKNLKLSILALFIVGLFVVSCSNEDESPVATDETSTTDNTSTDNTDNTDDTTPVDTTIVVGDTTFMIVENSEEFVVIGVLSATTNHGSVTFSIKSQSVDGALVIDNNSGEVAVGDVTAFDYETNPSLTAVVSVMNGTKVMEANVTVELEDQDAFLSVLTDSKSAYESASDGDWVIITQAEYEELAKIEMSNEVGVTSTHFPNTLSGTLGKFGTNYTSSSVGSAVGKIPSGGGLYDFKYYLNKSSFTQTNAKVKVSSTSSSTGFADAGNVLPSHSGVGIHYFVYKGSPTMLTSEGYMGTYLTGIATEYSVPGSIAGVTCIYGKGDVADMPNPQSNAMYMQGLSTTKVQW